MNVANANGQANAISLAAGTYVLTSPDNTNADGPNGLPSITGSLIIAGAGDKITGIGRQDTAPAFRLIHVAATGNLTLQGVTLYGGGGDNLSFALPGSGLFNNGGAVTITTVTISGNAVVDGQGGGIFNGGTMTINESAVTGNQTVRDNGGNIYNGGTMTITSSTVSGGFTRCAGGGVANGGTLRITNSSITGNFATYCQTGGGVFNFGTLTITNSTIARNGKGDAGGGGALTNLGVATIAKSTISSNSGGTDQGSGGVFNSGLLTIIDSTVGNNFGSGVESGGLTNSGTVTITNSTFAENRGGYVAGGIANHSNGSITLRNTILAMNTIRFTTSESDCGGLIMSLDHNLIGTTTNCAVALQSNDLTGDPGLDTLADNGKPGNGHFPLLPTSRAIDAGNDAACPPTDQLGTPRIGHCDIGAIEFFVPVTIDIKPGNRPTSINPRSRADIPVAILTTPTFDATLVDASTIRFGKFGTEAAAVHLAREDVNGDGILDMIFQFKTQDTGITCGGTSASLTGETLSKLAIYGTDVLVTVGCH
jgi:hypothetical protein